MNIRHAVVLAAALLAGCTPAPSPVTVASYVDKPHLVVRQPDGKLALVDLSDPGGPRTPTGARCDRAFATKRRTLCLQLTGMRLVTEMYGPDYVSVWSREMTGKPSRTRVSPDESLAATTVFVAGDAYNQREFSTRTELFDANNGAPLGDLEQYTLLDQAGANINPVERNYWGVTFSPRRNVFYAAVKYAGVPHIAAGDLAARTLRVIADGGGCPSVSPDGRHVVFKTAVPDGSIIRTGVSIVDTESGAVRALPEDRDFDEQVAWLDDRRVLYTVRGDIWVLPIDGGTPQLFMKGASSPSVVR